MSSSVMSSSVMSSSSQSDTATSDGSGSTFNPAPTQQPETLSILQGLGYSHTSCGYCAEEKGSRSTRKGGRSYGCWAHALSCKTYKDLIDRGWRRSGKYLYKPDMATTCCPQYTISLDATAFKPSKSQRQLLSRFNAFVEQGGRAGTPGWGPVADSDGDVAMGQTAGDQSAGPAETGPRGGGAGKGSNKAQVKDSLLSTAVAVNFNTTAHPKVDADPDNADFLPGPSSTRHRAPATKQAKASQAPATTAPTPTTNKGKGKASNQAPNLSELVHHAEWSNSPADQPFAHQFTYTLEPASFSEEKYALFHKYQTLVHGESEGKVTKKGFRRFLCDSPLDLEPVSAELSYGSHHGLWRLDGKLIAMAVLDILPGAVSSVYLCWDKDYSGMGLGKVSALREAAMANELGGFAYMMGFYIHTCPKMKYKADYQPSFLLDPDTNNYYPWAEAKERLDITKHASFSKPVSEQRITTREPTPALSDSSSSSSPGSSVDDEDVEWPATPPPGCLDPNKLPKELLFGTCVLEGRTLVPLLFSSAWHDEERSRTVRELLAATGESLAGRIAVWVE